MGFLGHEVSREFIAVPDAAKSQILYKWPDINIRRFSRVIVEPDQVAVFISRGELLGVLPPGRHPVDAKELPFLGAVIDNISDGRAYRSELYFVGTREYAGERFGAQLDSVADPATGLVVTLRVFGEYSMRVIDAPKLILNLTGTVDVTDNNAIGNWVDSQLLKVLRADVTRQITRNGWPILGLSAYTEEIETAVLAAVAGNLDPYGLAVARMGNFELNIDDEDAARLKTLSKDVAYTRLTGSFTTYAAGEALLGAGEGMAKGGGGANAALFATGLGMGGLGAGAFQQAPPPGTPQLPPLPGPQPQQPQQNAPAAAAPWTQPPQPQSGSATPEAGANCAECGNGPLSASAKFCPHCGSPVRAPQPSFCSGCGTSLPPGTRFCPNCGTPQGGAATPPPAGGAPA